MFSILARRGIALSQSIAAGLTANGAVTTTVALIANTVMTNNE